MKHHTKIIAILPAYNAQKTLVAFLRELPTGVFDDIILSDDCSTDETFALANRQKGIQVYQTPRNLGYGGNVKFCLAKALENGADIMVELHPDGEYGLDGIAPALQAVGRGAKLVLGNRFVGNHLPTGMFWWKYPFTRLLTAIDNLVLGTSIADMHQGFRVYTKDLVDRVNLGATSDDYLFSFQIIAQAAYWHLSIASVPVRAQYSGVKRGAKFWPTVRYTLETFVVVYTFLLARWGYPGPLFQRKREG